MDNIDSRTSSASSIVENEQSLTALTSRAITSRPSLVEPAIAKSSTDTRDVSTTMLDTIKPNGPSLNSVSTFVGPSTSTSIQLRPMILVQRPSDEFVVTENMTPPPSQPPTETTNEQKIRSAPVILPSNTKNYSSTANHKPNCNVHSFPVISEDLFNEQPLNPPRNFEIQFETLEELVAYEGPSVTDV